MGLQSSSFSLDTLLFCFCFYAIVRSSHDFVTKPKAVPTTLNTCFLIVISMTETLFRLLLCRQRHQFFLKPLFEFVCFPSINKFFYHRFCILTYIRKVAFEWELSFPLLLSRYPFCYLFVVTPLLFSWQSIIKHSLSLNILNQAALMPSVVFPPPPPGGKRLHLS